ANPVSQFQTRPPRVRNRGRRNNTNTRARDGPREGQVATAEPPWHNGSPSPVAQAQGRRRDITSFPPLKDRRKPRQSLDRAWSLVRKAARLSIRHHETGPGD